VSDFSSNSKFWLGVIAWLIGTFLAMGAAYTTMSSRVAVVETKQEADDQWKVRIEDKVDAILQRLPK
jgi:hypothetical protein